jgi:DNA-binding CsgD family transcriptional regulator
MITVSQLNELARIATEVDAQAQYENELFDRLERMVGFDVAFFKRQGGPGAVVRGLDYGWLAARERALLDCSHEAFEVIAAAGRAAGVAVDVHVLGQRRLERLRYYDVLVKPAGGRSSALLPLACLGEHTSTLVLGLGRVHRAREVELLEQLAPTLRLCEGARFAREQARHRQRGQALPVCLTAAEREVLSFLRLGYTNAEIARARGNAERTVRNQLSSAYAKLGVSSRAEAVAALVESGGLH